MTPTTVANIEKKLSLLSKRYVNHFFYGSKQIDLQKLNKLYNLIKLSESDITLDKKLKKIYSEYD
jgi:hypothetical protein